jgi:hypothetical protein
MKYFKVPAMCAGFMILLACSEEREVKPLTYTKIFTGETQKTWVVEQVLVKKVGQNDQEIQLSQCEADDRYTFKADEVRTYEISNGGIRCDEEEEDVYVEHTWSFVNAGAVLNIAMPRLFGNFIVPFIVREVNKSKMVLEIYANAENTISYQIILKAVEEQ